jgi:hypothetical protein
MNAHEKAAVQLLRVLLRVDDIPAAFIKESGYVEHDAWNIAAIQSQRRGLHGPIPQWPAGLLDRRHSLRQRPLHRPCETLLFRFQSDQVNVTAVIGRTVCGHSNMGR